MGDLVYVFDIDGVILDSKRVKRSAWCGVFSDRPPADDKVLQTLVDAKVGDRYMIIRRALEQVDGKDLSDAAIGREGLVERYADRYDALVRLGIRERGLFPGVARTLETLGGRYSLYANSKTPQTALESTLAEFGIARHFRELLGSSRSKAENLLRVIEVERVEPCRVVMIGDEEGDLSAAIDAGCVFVGIADETNGWVDGRESFPVLSSVVELVDLRVPVSAP